jgi:hypothetical protein
MGKKMRSTLLIASIFAGLLAGSGIAAAQIVDDPPGSVFQTQQIQEGLEGVRGTPSVNFRPARRAAAARQARAYAYIPVPSVRHHKVVRHHHHR